MGSKSVVIDVSKDPLTVGSHGGKVDVVVVVVVTVVVVDVVVVGGAVVVVVVVVGASVVVVVVGGPVVVVVVVDVVVVVAVVVVVPAAGPYESSFQPNQSSCIVVPLSTATRASSPLVVIRSVSGTQSVTSISAPADVFQAIRKKPLGCFWISKRYQVFFTGGVLGDGSQPMFTQVLTHADPFQVHTPSLPQSSR